MAIAIFSPNKNAYSETFIQAHKELPFKIYYYYDGYLPNKIEGEGSIINKFMYQPSWYLKNFFKFDLHEYKLRKSLEKKRIRCILAEYGVTAAESLRVIKSLNIPLIVHFHGYDASKIDIIVKYQKKYIEVFTYCNYVIVVSKKMAIDIENLGCPLEKIILNPYGPNNLYFSSKPSFKNRQFIYIGRFVEKKAPYLTLLAFYKVLIKYPDATLKLGGDGDLISVCKNIVKSLKIEKNITFLGKLKPEEIKLLFEDSIAYIQHSITAFDGDSEGTPVAIIEASAAGLPVISTIHAGIPDVVQHNISGYLVNEYDIDKMAEFMVFLCENRNIASQIGENGRKIIKTNFTLSKHLNMLTNLINKTYDKN